MSIPPPSSGRRQPASLLARMQRYWLGGAVTFMCVAGSFIVLAFVMPPTYESTSTIEVTGSGPADPKATVEEIRKAVFESGRIEDLARHAEPGDDPLSGLDRVRRSFGVAARSERAFSISYDGRSPESSLHGAELLLDAVLEHFAHDAARHDEKQARADLEKRTRELADFVTLHPDFSPASPSARPSMQASPAPTAPRDDPTLSVLRQERVRLESRLAAAQSATAQPGDANPYDDQTESDVMALSRQLAQVRLAIVAHQKALAQRAESPPVQSVEATAEAARRASLDSEWKRLVRSVVEAQTAPPPGQDAKPPRTARIVEQPRLPSRPIKPNRPLTSFVGVLLGVAAGAVWAFTRVNITDRARRRAAAGRATAAQNRSSSGTVSSWPPPALSPGTPQPAGSESRTAIGLAATVAVPAAGESAVAPTGASAGTSALAVAEPGRRSLSPSEGTDVQTVADRKSPAPEPAASRSPSPEPRRGLRDLGTQRGMIDAAFVKAHTGTAPQSLSERVEAKRIVDVSRDRRSDPPPAMRDREREPIGGSEEDRPSRSVTPAGPSSAVPITQRIGTPSDPAEANNTTTRPPPTSDSDRPDTSYSFVDRGWRATTKRGSSRPPSRPPERPEAGRQPADRARSVTPPSPELRPPPGINRPIETIQGIAPANPTPVVSPASPTPMGLRPPTAEARVTSNVPSATRPGWARPSPPATAAVSEVWTKVSQTSEPARDEDLVEPRSVPPNWGGLSGRSAEAPDGQIAGLSDKLRELSTTRCLVVGVVSDRAELDAKSSVAAALATMTAESVSRVLLMEANFDWPAVHRQMAVSMPNFSGFSQQMHARTRKGEKRPWIVVRCSPSLDVLAEGIVRSPGVLYSQQFAEAVAELRQYYRVIICDGPVVGGADARPLDAVTDGLIVVAPSERALMTSLDGAAKWFGKKQLLAAVPAVAR